MMLGSCLFKLPRWQHSAMGRGASFDILAIVDYALLTQYVQRRRN